VIDSYKLFRSDRQIRRGEGAALYVKNWIDCTKLSLKNSNTQVKNLRVKIETKPTKGTLWLVSTTGHTIKKRRLIKSSFFDCRKHHACRP